MSSSAPYIGSKISLVSNSEIRYEGILYTINTQESTIALQAVRCCGTEGRKVPEIMPSSEIYDFIIFRGQDIKDLTVLETAGHLSDPAIMSVNQRPAGGTGKGAGSKGKDTGAASGKGKDTRGSKDSRSGVNAKDSWGGGKASGGGAKDSWGWNAGGGWGSSWGASANSWGSGGKDHRSSANAGSKGGSGQGYSSGGWWGMGGGKASTGSKTNKGKDAGKGKDKGKDAGKGGKDAGKGGKDKGKGKGKGSENAKAAGKGRRGAGGESRNGATIGELAPSVNEAEKTKYATDFDYEAETKKFEKNVNTDDVEEKFKPREGYNKGTSFFDNISCEATDRASGGERPKMDRTKARQNDVETFGDTLRPPRPAGQRRGGKGTRPMAAPETS